MLHFVTIFIARKLIMRYVSFNITGKQLFLNPKSLPGLELSVVFGTNNLVLRSFLLSCLVTRATETTFTGTRTQDNFRSYLGSVLLSSFVIRATETIFTGTQTRDNFRSYGPCPAISSLKQITLVLVSFFYRA
jgi:hypothetical protein